MKNSKDTRYRLVKVAFKKGKISCFADLFNYIPRTVVARDLDYSPASLELRIENVGKFTYGDAVVLAELIEVEEVMILTLLINAPVKWNITDQARWRRIAKTFRH